MNLRIMNALACLLVLVMASSVFAEIKENKAQKNGDGDYWRRSKVIFKDSPRSTGLDTIVDTERDTSKETYNPAGADNFRLYTRTRQLTASDTVFVNALVISPWDSTGYVTVPLDTILTVGANDDKDVASLVNTYNSIKFELVGGNTGSADSAEVRVSVDQIWKSR